MSSGSIPASSISPVVKNSSTLSCIILLCFFISSSFSLSGPNTADTARDLPGVKPRGIDGEQNPRGAPGPEFRETDVSTEQMTQKRKRGGNQSRNALKVQKASIQ